MKRNKDKLRRLNKKNTFCQKIATKRIKQGQIVHDDKKLNFKVLNNK